ncbi:MAG: GNAT family N-acetyltransferase [Candidatus Eremiobacteraeota bacterium]|nr:GNAT family N-acetyltransferase [Candidatus Eremiobacteraeota bacterium]
MRLTDGYHSVPAGKIADVQTFLQMREPPTVLRPAPDNGWTLERVQRPDLTRYRALLHRVGDDYLWAVRVRTPDAELERFLRDPSVEAYLLVTGGGDEGILELDFRVARECELSLFGVVRTLVASGAGRWLLNKGIEIAWAHPIDRFWLHTCNLDHPNALAFYQRSGFSPFKREVEIYDDPRVTGVVSKDAAPHVPIL